MLDHWIADRMSRIEASGIRKIFELGRGLKDPVNLSIGQPHFEVPEPIRKAAKAAIDRGRQWLHRYPGHSRAAVEVAGRCQIAVSPGKIAMFSSPAGTSGGFCSRFCATVNPGEEVITIRPVFRCLSAPRHVGGRRLVSWILTPISASTSTG